MKKAYIIKYDVPARGGRGNPIITIWNKESFVSDNETDMLMELARLKQLGMINFELLVGEWKIEHIKPYNI